MKADTVTNNEDPFRQINVAVLMLCVVVMAIGGGLMIAMLETVLWPP